MEIALTYIQHDQWYKELGYECMCVCMYVYVCVCVCVI